MDQQIDRGVRKQPIYLEDADRRLFVRILRKVARERRWTVHVFALMTNHYHLVVQTPDGDISEGMQYLNGVYAMAFNGRHAYEGHVFERRFWSRVIESEADYRTFFTTRTTFVDRRLAAIYNIAAPAQEGFARVDLPTDGPRAGFFGHVAFLALHAHPVSSSATRRGVFIRKTLLCQIVPSPPAGLNTSIPEPSPDATSARLPLPGEV